MSKKVYSYEVDEMILTKINEAKKEGVKSLKPVFQYIADEIGSTEAGVRNRFYTHIKPNNEERLEQVKRKQGENEGKEPIKGLKREVYEQEYFFDRFMKMYEQAVAERDFYKSKFEQMKKLLNG